MSIATRLLNRAMMLFRAGNKKDARRLLLEVIRQEPTNETAWLWYLKTFEDRATRISALKEFLDKFPGNKQAQREYKALIESGIGTPATSTARSLTLDEGIARQKSIPSQGTYAMSETRSERAVAAKVSQAGQENTYQRLLGCGGWIVSLGVIILLVMGLVLSNNAYESSERRNHELKMQVDLLRHDNLVRKSEHDSLQLEHSQLLSRHELLLGDFNRLNDDYKALHEQHRNLVNQYNSLVDDYDRLNDEYVKLNNEAVKPPYILIHDRSIDMAFRKLDNTLSVWTIPFDSLESSILKGYEERTRMTQIMLSNDDETYRVHDYRAFVDSQPFRRVISELYEQAESPRKFIEEVWLIITQLSNYSSEIGDVPRLPLETLLEGGGDCEDLSILFASLIKAANTDWKVALVYMDIYNPTDPQEVNHVVVHIDTDERGYLIETTSDEVMEPYDDGIVGWFIEID